MTTSIQNIGANNLEPSSSGGGSKSVSKDEFLKLLTYQLRAQNPMRPYDNQEFAAQLAQFSQLEQLTDIRNLIEEQIQTNLILTRTISNTALPGLIGKNAKAYSGEFEFDGSNPVALSYSLPYSAASGEAVISDANGNVIQRVPLDPAKLRKGDHTFVWDGKDRDGNSAASGAYSITYNCKDAKGSSFEADSYITGKIEAVRFKSEGTVLVIRGVEVALQNVFDISTENI